MEWLVSEVEGQWCELFLRAATPVVARAVVGAIAARQTGSADAEATRSEQTSLFIFDGLPPLPPNAFTVTWITPRTGSPNCVD